MLKKVPEATLPKKTTLSEVEGLSRVLRTRRKLSYYGQLYYSNKLLSISEAIEFKPG